MQRFLRPFATPLVIAIFLAIATTGIIMFFDLDARGLKDVHKWIGITFVTAVILHIAFNWRQFLARFGQATGVVIMLLVTLVAFGFIGAFQFGHMGGERGPNPTRQVLNAMMKAPLSASAPVLGMTADDAVAKLKAKGLKVSGPDQSLRDVAKASDAELPEVLGALLAKDGAGEHEGHDHDH